MKGNLAICMAVIGLLAFIGVQTHDKPGRHSGTAYRKKLSALSTKNGQYRAYRLRQTAQGGNNRSRHSDWAQFGSGKVSAPAGGYAVRQAPESSR